MGYIAKDCWFNKKNKSKEKSYNFVGENCKEDDEGDYLFIASQKYIQYNKEFGRLDYEATNHMTSCRDML
jgi:hypothetical protein